MRPLVLVAIAALGAAMCGDDSASLDGGADATADVARDTVTPVDAIRDDGPAVLPDVPPDSHDAGLAGWTRLPGAPDFCEAEYAMAPAAAIDVAWDDCPSGSASSCSVLSIPVPSSVRRTNVASVLSPTGASTPLAMVSQVDEVVPADQISIQLLDPTTDPPTVLAAFRYTGSIDQCRIRQAATDGTSLGFELALPDKESLFFRTDVSSLPAMPDEPIGRLTEAEQPGAVGTQDMQISPTTLGVVLQPGAVLWLFEEGLQMRRGGPLEPGVPGAVLNQFSIVDRRLYWATSANLVLAESLEAPSELLHDPAGDLGIRWPQADYEFVVWEEWDGADGVDLWAAPVPDTASELAPRHIAALPQINLLSLGEGLVAFRQTEPGPERILLYDLREDLVLEWIMPFGWDAGNEMVWVNRSDVGVLAAREGQIFFTTIMRVPVSSFESL